MKQVGMITEMKGTVIWDNHFVWFGLVPLFDIDSFLREISHVNMATPGLLLGETI